MERLICEVYAKVVDANGTYNTLSGYPKVFDSKFYDNDLEKTLRRAKAEYHETYGAMLKRDDRQVQTIFLMNTEGWIYESNTVGKLAELPDPEPETESESEGT